MNRCIIILAVAATALAITISGSAIDSETRKIMPFVAMESPIFCTPCHNTNEIASFKSPAMACATYCKTCHKEYEAHHKVGVVIKGKLPPELNRLNAKGELACYTCHDLTGKRYAPVPYKAESLFGKLFDFSSQYKTYYLPVRNNDGGLCKVCH